MAWLASTPRYLFWSASGHGQQHAGRLSVTRTFVTAWLTDRSDPVLRGESARFPEVDFQP